MRATTVNIYCLRVIDDSIPWKEELAKVADRLDAKTKQKRWTDRTAYLIERDFMVSAYAMRKLIDAFKVSDALRLRQISVERFEPTSRPISYLGLHIEKSYDIEHGRRQTLSVMNLCHQIVHSFVFVLSCDESTGLLDGVYVTSDYDKDKYLFFIRATDFITLCHDIGAEDVDSKSMVRGPDGRWRATEILGRPS
jgi:hypothetical protein